MNGLGGREGVAISDSPSGPFTEPTQIEHTDMIDPAVLVDDDGRSYFFWGQIELSGAELNPDMRSIKTDTIERKILTEKDHHFIEGACIRKVRGKYYLVYNDISRGRSGCLAYAVSDNPLGPYERKGVIIDNAGCGAFSWNNHGSICEFNGQWYVFYHRGTLGGKYSRKACIEPIEILPDGSIPEVEMTTQGVEGPIDASREIEAHRACYFFGTARSAFDDELEFITSEMDNDYVSYKYLSFNNHSKLYLKFRGQGVFRMHLSNPLWVPHCRITLDSSGEEWNEICTPIDSLTGVDSIHFAFESGNLELFSFRFE